MWIRPIALYGAPAYSSGHPELGPQDSSKKEQKVPIADLHEEGCLIPLKAEAVRSSHRFKDKKVDDSLIHRLLEHRIMLDYNRYKRACPSKTPIDLT